MVATKLNTSKLANDPLLGGVRADVFVFGIPFWNATYEEFLSWWQGVLTAAEPKGLVLAFANANTLNHVFTNEVFARALEQADVIVNDGIGVRIACKLRGVSTRYNLNGTDLIPRLFRETVVPIRVFLYGATEDANSRAADAVRAMNPLIEVVGRINGYVDPVQEAIPAIQASTPDVVLIALGHPRQEVFAVEHRSSLGSKLIVPCGGLFDFLSGIKPRAPRVLRSTGLEWVYRLALEPRRMFWRYIVGNPLFISRSAARAPADRALLRKTLRTTL